MIGKALGIRAHDIKVIKEREYADAKCVVEDVIESTFDMIYLLRRWGEKTSAHATSKKPGFGLS